MLAMRGWFGRNRSMLVAPLAGAVLVLAFAPFDWPLLAPGCVAVLFWFWRVSEPARAAAGGFLFGLALFLAGTYWTFISVRIFGQAPTLLAVFLMFALAALMAGYYALLGYVCRRWLRHSSALAWLCLWPAAWTLAEWLRGWVFTGFPWLSLGYSQIDTPLSGYAAVLGVYGVSLVTAVTAGALLALVAGDRTERLASVAILALTWGGGLWLAPVDWAEPDGEPLRVSLIQGSISQDRKWLPEEKMPTLELYRDLTVAELGRDLVVWPEVAVPAMLDRVGGYLGQLAAAAAAADTALVLGILRRDPDTSKVYNSLIVLGGQAQVYDKRHLVPFGEFFPVPGFVRDWMRLLSLPHSDLGAGEKRQAPLRAAGVSLAPSICYEDVFGEEQLDFLPEAGVLVNVSNDAWFGDSIAAHQHLQIARMRSRESARYMIRSTNTGISAIIDARGRIVERSPQFVTHVLRGVVERRQGATPYVRLGNSGVVVLALVMLAIGAGLAGLGGTRRSVSRRAG